MARASRRSVCILPSFARAEIGRESPVVRAGQRFGAGQRRVDSLCYAMGNAVAKDGDHWLWPGGGHGRTEPMRAAAAHHSHHVGAQPGSADPRLPGAARRPRGSPGDRRVRPATRVCAATRRGRHAIAVARAGHLIVAAGRPRLPSAKPLRSAYWRRGIRAETRGIS